MALDHRRLIRPGQEPIKFDLMGSWPGKKNSGRIFCVRQVYFTKSCQQIWVRVNQPFITFIRHIWGETVYEALFLSYRARTTECSISQYCDTNCYSGRSKHVWALAVNRWKNFQNHLCGQPVLTFTVLAVASVWMNINRVTLQHIKEFYMFIFYFKTV